jgi:hypothetical protein
MSLLETCRKLPPNCRLSATQAEHYDPSKHDIRPGPFKLLEQDSGMLQLYYSDSAEPNRMLI